MKVTEEKERRNTYTKVLKRVCDICGTESDGDAWDGGTYTIDETELKVTAQQQQGQGYPEGGWKEIIEVDLCPGCFKDRFVPWVEEQGDTTIEPSEVDW